MKEQIKNLCIQIYYNLYGVMPGAQELAEMIEEDVSTLMETRRRETDQSDNPGDRTVTESLIR